MRVFMELSSLVEFDLAGGSIGRLGAVRHPPAADIAGAGKISVRFACHHRLAGALTLSRERVKLPETNGAVVNASVTDFRNQAAVRLADADRAASRQP